MKRRGHSYSDKNCIQQCTCWSIYTTPSFLKAQVTDNNTLVQFLTRVTTQLDYIADIQSSLHTLDDELSCALDFSPSSDREQPGNPVISVQYVETDVPSYQAVHRFDVSAYRVIVK